MSQQYDASTKYLIEIRLGDWLPLCGRATTARVEIIDAELATVTARADRVLKVYEDPAWILHVELQAGRDVDLPGRLMAYNVLLWRRHRLHVRTVVVLLKPAADGTELTGQLTLGFPAEEPYHVFRYHVVRVWELPVERFLAGGLGILPLAPLADVGQEQLPAILRRMAARINADASAEEAGVLWTATDILMGLRYPPERVHELMRGVFPMKESATYQAIVEEGRIEGRTEGRIEGRTEGRIEGRIEEAQAMLLRIGRKLLGPPGEELETAIRRIDDLDRLNRMADQLPDVTSWSELLAIV